MPGKGATVRFLFCAMRIVWTRFIPPPSPVAVIQDDQGTPVAVSLNPLLARPLAAVLESLNGEFATATLTARVDLARHLARRLGLEETQVREALEWATRRAGVEIVPDRVIVQIGGSK